MSESKTTFFKRMLSTGFACMLMISLILSFCACGKTDTDASSDEPQSENNTSEQTQETVITNPLTGEAGFNAEAVGKRPYAVVVENHPAARPQWGLCSPDIVIEGLVEGGISRMLWIYADVDSIPSQIGPVRSARVDYVEMAAGFDAIYVHWGGASADGISAYSKIKQLGVDHIDGMAYENRYFGRDYSTKSGEHTGYTKSEWLKSASQALSFKTDISSSYKNIFSFNSEKATLSGGACSSVTTGFSDEYKHTFKYDETDGLYYNYMNSAAMKDSNGKQMAVSNVLILFANYTVFDSAGHINYDLSGGNGLYISNGSYQNIKWKKGNGGTEPLKLFNEDGSELSLNQGKSWIGFVPPKMRPATKISE